MEKNLVNMTSTDSLIKLFDKQMNTLLERNCPQKIIDVFMSKKNAVIAQAMEIDIPDDHIPFIPVVPRTEVSLDDLMKMVRNRNLSGYSHLNASDIRNVVNMPKGNYFTNIPLPKKAYFILDVENGTDTLNTSPVQAEMLINEQGLGCLIVDEGIALCVHTNTLPAHFVDCTGSRYQRDDSVPFISLDDNFPRLGSRHYEDSGIMWGSPSCKARM